MCISGNKRRRSILSLSDVTEFVAEGSDNNSHFYDDGSTIDSEEQVECQEVPQEKPFKRRARHGRNSSRRIFNESIHREEKSVIQHDYHDHSTEDETSCKKRIVSRGGVTTPFPMKLFSMLEHIDEVDQDLSDVISWLPHGRAFKVHKPKKFADTVLPRFFHQNKYASFQRQLNLYGFSRITRKGADRGSYYHEYFLRGKKFLCNSIHRFKVKGTGARRSSNPDAEPDFYNMPPVKSSSEEFTPILPSSSGETSVRETVEVTANHTDQNILRFTYKPMPSLSSSEVSVAVKEEQGVEMDRFNSTQDQQNILPFTYKPMPPLSSSEVPVVAKEEHGVEMDHFNSTQDRQLPFTDLYQLKSSAEKVKLEKDALNDDLEFVFNDMPFHSLPLYDEQLMPDVSSSNQQQPFHSTNIHSCQMSKTYQMYPSEAAGFDKDIESMISMEGRAMNDQEFSFLVDSLIFH